ncbi:MAG: shikimate kinase [Paracoccus sp. (in: a-proteobacteria)]|jgi:shikimate kinase|uniref:shikimate kinase n=1 Tax=unclassified Paracoccus (in: a-proteobacteria) TaxID=2688777 RepID=UPI000C4036B5|nr:MULTISPECIES: shikimate kinase [unclassified Paracoccus (in: a-proteobacteria)]MAN57180.1 shikimate kinase [Paracoccus sp. (in: a-proteobacteria)]MBA48971.1 shikimate kinase [Paracoccus sp. (in: a-proteobacteria)]MCS5600955.1 shikimate kinase [Paracoccus sp. (in: a-proteobacteria)]HIC65099.1 shikimate kinase [Paracoccus sp. (in: a-proteobacteria)]
MAQRLGRHILLIGMMGAGKTAVGHELARRLRVPFTDSDTEIEAAAAMTISEIFARDGEAFFRDRESQVIARILGQGPGVISTGGGAWMQARNREMIRRRAMSVWLNCDLEILWHRVRQRATRPLLQTADPKGTLEHLLAQRAPVYAMADLDFRVRSGDSIEQSATRLLQAIRHADADLLQETK